MGNIKYSDLYYKEFGDNYDNTPYPIRSEEDRIKEALM
jgi:hypothetical protein